MLHCGLPQEKLTPSRFKKHLAGSSYNIDLFLPHFFAQKRKRGEKNEVDMSFKEVKQTTFGCNKHCHWISSWASRACDKKTSGRLTTHNGCFGEFLSLKYFRQISILGTYQHVKKSEKIKPPLLCQF